MPGMPGVPGPQGPQGRDGAKGETGEKGLQGMMGPRGEKGSEGSRGKNGAPGMMGRKGDKGNEGSRGNSGPPGMMGIKGERGLMGDKGRKGDKGEKGESVTSPPSPVSQTNWKQCVWKNLNDNRDTGKIKVRQSLITRGVHLDVTQGAEESNSTEISVKFTVSMRRRLTLLFKVPYVTLVLVMRSCYASKLVKAATSYDCGRRCRYALRKRQGKKPNTT